MDKRKAAAKHLFEYIFILRYKRRPYEWEWVLGWALICEDLRVLNPVGAQQLVAIHAAAKDVQRALGLVEKAS